MMKIMHDDFKFADDDATGFKVNILIFSSTEDKIESEAAKAHASSMNFIASLQLIGNPMIYAHVQFGSARRATEGCGQQVRL